MVNNISKRYATVSSISPAAQADQSSFHFTGLPGFTDSVKQRLITVKHLISVV